MTTPEWTRPQRRKPVAIVALAAITLATLLIGNLVAQESAAVPEIVRSGIGPLILEYIDMLTMAAATAYVGLDLGIPEAV